MDHSSHLIPDHFQSNAFIESVMDMAHQPMLLLTADLLVRQGNAAFYRQFSMVPTDLFGKKVYELGHGKWNIPRLHELLDSLLPAQKHCHGFELHYESEPIGPCVLSIDARVIDDRGHILLSIEEIVQENPCQEQPNGCEKMLRLFIENAPTALAMFDRQMRYLYVSPRWRQDFNLGDRPLKGFSHYDIFPEIPDKWREAHRRGLAGEVLRADEDPFEREDGTIQWVSWELRPWFKTGGAIGGIVISSKDITRRMRAQKSVAASEKKYRELLEAANSIIIRWDTNGIIRFINGYGAQFFGYSPDELMNQPVMTIVPQIEKSSGRNLEENIRDIVIQPENYVCAPSENLTKDGQTVWVAWTNKAITDDQGEVQEILSIGNDITPLKEAEAALKAQEEQFRVMFMRSSVPMAQADLSTGQFLRVNPAFCQLTRRSEEELLRRTFGDVTHPDDREEDNLKIAALVRGDFANFQREKRYIRPDGSIKWGQVTVNLLNDANGRPTRTMAVIQDISERKIAEAKFQERELFYRQTIESIPGLVFTTGPEGLSDFHSQQWVDFTGIALNEQLGHRWTELLHPDDQQRASAAWREAIEELAPYNLEYRIRRHDGAYEWFKVRARPIHDENGKIDRWFGTAVNIDQLVQTQKALQKAKDLAEAATQAKSQFLANMSHELRTPMTGVLGMIDLVLLSNLNGEQQSQLEAAKSSAQSLLRILNDIFDFSRIEAGMLSLANEPFNLHETIRGAMELFRLESSRKGLVLELDLGTDVPFLVIGDEGRVRQILINLLGNAVKFTEQGKVALHVAAAKQRTSASWDLTFSVIDTGIGIAKEQHELLFKPFSQTDVSHSRRFGGTGLGLSIVNQVVQRMGGRVSFISDPGQGSTFVVKLPLLEAMPDVETVTTSPQMSTRSNASQLRLLVLEDDPTIRKLLGIMLPKEHFDFDAGCNGYDAIDMWAPGKYDLILMDVQMPRMDGFEATRMIRAMEKEQGGHIPIIALTAHAFPTDKEKCLEAGMDAYLAKPIDFNELFALIESLLTHKVMLPAT